MRIIQQGAPIIEDLEPYYLVKHDNIVAFAVDMTSMYCKVECDSYELNAAPSIFIGANEHSLSLKENVDRDSSTELEFSEYIGWSVLSAKINRDTLTVVLIKKEV